MRLQLSNAYLVLIGVAYSRHIVQIYSYHGGDDIRQHLEVWLHVLSYFCLIVFYVLSFV